MAEMILEFYVKDQTLVRKKDGKVPRTDSLDYLYLKFNYDDNWKSLRNKIAYIGNADEKETVWSEPIDLSKSNIIKAPNNYLKRNFFLVYLQGTDSSSIITNVVKVLLPDSGAVESMGPLPEEDYEKVTELIGNAQIAASAAQTAAEQAIGAAPTIELQEVPEGVKITVQNYGEEEQSYIVKDVKGGGTYVQSEEPVDAPDGAIWIDTDENPPEIKVPQVFVQNEEPAQAEDGAVWIDTDEDPVPIIFVQSEEPADALDGSIWIDTDENPPEIEAPRIFEQENEPIEAKDGDLWIDTNSFLEEVDPTVPNWAKQPNKPKYTAAEVGAATPQYVHEVVKEAFQNSGAGGGITEEKDPTVPAWAKQPQKPKYTAEEVGALPNTTQIPSVPSALPNPFALSFSGAASGTYDGSASLAIEIPQGGGSDKWEFIGEFNVGDEDVSEWIISEDAEGNPIELKQMHISITSQPASINTGITDLMFGNPSLVNPFATNGYFAKINCLRTSEITKWLNAIYVPQGNKSAVLALQTLGTLQANWSLGNNNAYGAPLKECIGGVAMKPANTEAAAIGAGSIVKMWGVRI